ncbi:metalloregulator ArsR/SmtB family transcription factor [Tunturiibacter empetritectus]|uniref:ArsR/SmtB family transcription factor n=1 Tax=Tunturiibacter empetritectus TaxID=3069691 RepID=UPI003D9BCE20
MKTYEQQQLDALGDVTRRLLLSGFAVGLCRLASLARGLTVSRPAVSQHLRVLKEAKLVRDEAAGARRYYSLDPKGFEALRKYLDNFWGEALEAFQAKVEEK